MVQFNLISTAPFFALNLIYCDILCFKKGRCQKRVSTALFAIPKLIQYQFVKSLVFQLGRISHSEK